MQKYQLRGQTKNGQIVYYTGRAGEGWVSANEAEAFYYDTRRGAQIKADRHNAYTPIHGIAYMVESVLVFA